MKYGLNLKSDGALDLLSLGALSHRSNHGINAGEMTLAKPPPMPLAAATRSPLAPILSAVARCRSVSMAMDEVSEPLIKPPSSPRKGAMTG